MQTVSYDGKEYELIPKDEVIGNRAIKSLDQGELRPVFSKDTMKLKPSDFYNEWRFYRPAKKKGTK